MAGAGALERLADEAGSAGVAAVDEFGQIRLRIRDEVPVVVQSVTKLVVALTAGAALSSQGDAVELAGEPVGTIIAEWAGDERGAVTIVDLLSHRSGLVPVPPHMLEAAGNPSWVALESTFDGSLRGSHHYNNASTFVVAEFVRRLTGAPIDVWVDRILEPTGHTVSWERSADGTAWSHGGLIATAAALAVFGSLALPRNGSSSPIPAEWVTLLIERAASAYPQPAWVDAVVTRRLVQSWLDAGVGEALVAPLGDLPDEGIPMETLMSQLDAEQLSALGAAVHSTGHRVAEIETGPVVGWGHDGDGGQWLIVCPDDGLAIAHTRSADNYARPPGFFPPRAVLDAI